MNKIERMKAVLENKTPDYTPAGFWFHFPAKFTAEEAAEGQLKLYRELDNDIIKVMDDNFGNMFTKMVCRVCLYRRPASVLLRTFRSDTC